ncbi:MAG: hypothetical protein J0I60_07250 [Nitrosospira sp.]|nr:hypothetical protein [Nitrosospira sp.]
MTVAKMSRRGCLAMLLVLMGGCSSKPIIQTRVVEKPIAVPCRIGMPPECKSTYAVDRVSPGDDALTINRALRAEIEERWACETKLRAALAGCNIPPFSPTH